MYTDPHPHLYTGGRWLRHDKLERDARYIGFDFDALRRKVIELCPGAASITNYEKKEGGFNRVFIFTTDNAKRVVARLPFAFAGPPMLTTNSEVATVQYRECLLNAHHRSTMLIIHTSQFKPIPASLYRRSWTGVTMLRTLSAVNTSSWNTLPAFSCIRDGQL